VSVERNRLKSAIKRARESQTEKEKEWCERCLISDKLAQGGMETDGREIGLEDEDSPERTASSVDALGWSLQRCIHWFTKDPRSRRDANYNVVFRAVGIGLERSSTI